MRKVVVATLMAITATMASASSAGAHVEWCDWDPSVVIVTPGLNIVPVFDSVWTSSLLDIGLPLESYTVHRTYDYRGRPVTAVDMTIYVPAGLLWTFPTRDVVSSGLLGSGHIYAEAHGTSGQPVHLKFTIPKP
jgi:hypothetical protein